MSLSGGVRSLVALLLLLYPALALTHRSGASATLHVLAVLGLIAMVRVLGTPTLRVVLVRFWRDYGVLCVAMLVPLAVNMLSMGYAGLFGDAFSTTVQRAAFSGFVLFTMLSCQRAQLARFQWGVLAGLLVTVGILFVSSSAGAVRPEPDAQNLLNYTNFVVLLGMYSLYMMGWRLTRFTTTEFLLKLLAFALAVYAVFLSDSRGPLLSMGILLAFYLIFVVRWCGLRWRLGACVGALVLLSAVSLQSDQMVPRLKESVHATIQSVPAMMQGDDPVGGDASTRVRLGLWKASWLMFKEHPWIGDGSRSFSDRLIDLNKAGLINDESTWKVPQSEAFVQSHNEVANTMANRGMAGLISLLLLYGVPFYYFIRQRARTDRFGQVAADMGILTCVGVVLFGLTVTVFTSGWMMAHYVLLICIFIALSRPTDEGAPYPEPRLNKGRLRFPMPWQQKLLRRTYRTVRGRSNRHSGHLWPYVKIRRNPQGYIERLSVLGHEVALTPIHEAFAGAGPDFHIILSGPSVADIDYSKLSGLQVLGVNGAILLQDKVDIEFPFYCIIDRTFVQNKLQVVERIVSEDRVLFLTPDVLRYVFQHIPLDRIRCRLCVLEDIAESAYKPGITPALLKDMQRKAADLTVFDDQIPLGFSFDPSLGWFDASTVAYAALHVVVWGGAQRVYFHGLDIKGAQSGPRFYEEGERPLETCLEQSLQTLIGPSFRQAVILLRERGVQVYNLSPQSALGPDVIPFVEWKELLR